MVGVEFMVNRFMMQLLIGYDKCLVDVVVFYEVLMIRFVENVGDFQCDVVGGFWDWNNDVNIQIFLFVGNFFVQFSFYVDVGVVDGNFVNK